VSARAELDVDLYTDEAILDPHPLYRAIRDRAAAVWLPPHKVWALGRFEDARAALRAHRPRDYGPGHTRTPRG